MVIIASESLRTGQRPPGRLMFTSYPSRRKHIPEGHPSDKSTRPRNINCIAIFTLTNTLPAQYFFVLTQTLLRY